jgi:hypothetical protein
MSMPHQIPETFPTTIVDRFLRAFYTGKGDIKVQLEMHFDCPLDKVQKMLEDMIAELPQ